MSEDDYYDGYTHEVLHTVHVLRTTWGQHVVNTRCCKQFPDIKAAADKVAKAMHDVHQLAAKKLSPIDGDPIDML